MATTRDSEFWQKLFMGLLSAVFVVLAGAYAKLASDVSSNRDDMATTMNKVSIIATEVETIRGRLDDMENADEVEATAERDTLNTQVQELQQQQRNGP